MEEAAAIKHEDHNFKWVERQKICVHAQEKMCVYLHILYSTELVHDYYTKKCS